jgi:polysaccharide export outer membrane protein
MLNVNKVAPRIPGLFLVFAAALLGNAPTIHAQSAREQTKKLYLIVGAVRNPGAFQIEGRVSALQLITLAGGLTENHGAVAFILQGKDASPDSKDDHSLEYQVTSINIQAIMRSPLKPYYLEPGDIVNVPQGDVFYIAGEVAAPGSFRFKEGITVLQAISLARGLKFSAKADKVIIFRQSDSDGKREEIKVDLDAVQRGDQKDILLQPNDIVVVPNSRAGIIPPHRFLDAPPIRGLGLCRNSRPCFATLD